MLTPDELVLWFEDRYDADEVTGLLGLSVREIVEAYHVEAYNYYEENNDEDEEEDDS